MSLNIVADQRVKKAKMSVCSLFLCMCWPAALVLSISGESPETPCVIELLASLFEVNILLVLQFSKIASGCFFFSDCLQGVYFCHIYSAAAAFLFKLRRPVAHSIDDTREIVILSAYLHMTSCVSRTRCISGFLQWAVPSYSTIWKKRTKEFVRTFFDVLFLKRVLLLLP